jgi:hypothetical protein
VLPHDGSLRISSALRVLGHVLGTGASAAVATVAVSAELATHPANTIIQFFI